MCLPACSPPPTPMNLRDEIGHLFLLANLRCFQSLAQERLWKDAQDSVYSLV